jgi:hypothetical protein
MLIESKDAEFYKIGAQCIIEVDCVNSPTGWWWGTIIKHEYLYSDRIKVIASITGGRFQIGDHYKPIYSDEYKDDVPRINYIIYPNPIVNGCTNLLWRFLQQENEICKLKQNYKWLEQLHIASKK